MVVEVSISVLESWFISQIKDISNILHFIYKLALKTSCGAEHIHLKNVSFTKISYTTFIEASYMFVTKTLGPGSYISK